MVRIRCATAADEAAVRSCAEAAYARYVAAIGRRPAPMIADFGASIAEGQLHVAVGCGDGIDGFIVYYPVDGCMHLENVAVRPCAAGAGLGRALIARCEADARCASLRAVRLYTNEAMTENLSIYPHLGYVETGRRVEDGFRRVYFEKVLA